MAAVTTISGFEPLAAAKAYYMDALTQLFNSCRSSSYTTYNYELICYYYNSGMYWIAESDSIDDAYDAYAYFATAIASVETKLATAKRLAKEGLDAFMAGLDEGDFSAEDWAALQAIVTSAKTSINSARTESQVTSLYNSAIAALELKLAKIAALAQIETWRDLYNPTHYSEANWTILMGLFDTAATDVNAATSEEEINTILSTLNTAAGEVPEEEAA